MRAYGMLNGKCNHGGEVSLDPSKHLSEAICSNYRYTVMHVRMETALTVYFKLLLRWKCSLMCGYPMEPKFYSIFDDATYNSLCGSASEHR